jgi:hypothetical protein
MKELLLISKEANKATRIRVFTYQRGVIEQSASLGVAEA